MNQVFSFINRLKIGFLKEEALQRYKKPPFNAREYEGPTSDAPPFLGGQKQKVEAPVNPALPDGGAAMRPGVVGPMAPAPVQAPEQAPGAGFAFEPKPNVQTKHTARQYFLLYWKLFNQKLEETVSESPINNEAVRDIFYFFLQEKQEQIKPIDQDREAREDGLSKLKEFFDKEYQLFISQGEQLPGAEEQEPEDAQGEEVSADRNLSEDDIEALFRINRISEKGRGHGSALANTVFDKMDKLPCFLYNENNKNLFDSMKPDLAFQLKPSNLGLEDRATIAEEFNKAYFQSGTEKEIMARMYMLGGADEKDDDEEVAKAVQYGRKVLKINPNIAPPGTTQNALAKSNPNIDPYSFVHFRVNNKGEFVDKKGNPVDKPDANIFLTNSMNKDPFLAFFLKRNMIDYSIGIIGDAAYSAYQGKSKKDSYEGDREILEKYKEGKRDKASGPGMQVIQNHGELFKEALINIMNDRNSPLRNEFFNWIQKKIMNRRETALGKGRFGGQEADSEGVAVGHENKDIDLTQRADTGFYVSFRLPIPTEVFNQEGLKNEGTEIVPGDTVDVSTLNSLKTNWAKMKGFMSDILQKMERAYQTTPDKGTKRAILQKLVFWSRVEQSCEKAVKNVTENIRMTGKNLSDDRSIAILNQDWSQIFKEERWREFDWSLEGNEDIQSVLQRAVADDLVLTNEEKKNGVVATPELAFERIIGSVDFKENVGTFQIGNAETSRDNTSNALNQKSKGSLVTLRDIIFDQELVDKYGGDTLISFVDVIGSDSDAASIGALLSKHNRGSIEDKMNYLNRLSQRGSINKNPVEIQNMSPKEIDELFNSVRDTLKVIYSPPSELKKMFQDKNSPITDAHIAQFAQMANVPHVRNKEEFAKANKGEKAAIQQAFYDTEFGKYYVDKLEKVETLKRFLAKYVNRYSKDDAFLARSGYPTGENFLSAIGITDPGSIDSQVDKMPQMSIFNIAKHFFPDLYEAYEKNVLSKTPLEKDKRMVDDIVKDLINIDKKAKGGLAAEPTLSDALFYADLFDSKRDLITKAFARFDLLRKISMQKEANQTALLKLRLSKFNVDIPILDKVIDGSIYGRRK